MEAITTVSFPFSAASSSFQTKDKSMHPYRQLPQIHKDKWLHFASCNKTFKVVNYIIILVRYFAVESKTHFMNNRKKMHQSQRISNLLSYTVEISYS